MLVRALLSIKPEFVDRIVSGEKRFEYRKRVFKENVSSVVIYATMPVGKIIGEFTVEEILSDTPANLWRQTSKHSGISKKFFMDYFHERTEAFALKIKNFQEYSVPVDPKDVFENFTAPQSFMYLNEDFNYNLSYLCPFRR